MNKGFLVSVFALVAATPVALHAQDTAPLGRSNVSLKFGYVVFSEGANELDGIYLGLAGYVRATSNLYLGTEVAQASSIAAIFGDDMTLVPLEVNLKYAGSLGPGFVVAGGAGLSYSYADFYDFNILDPSVTTTAWLFGGQFFGDFVYRIKWFDFGISVKYQLVDEFEEVAADFSNLRVGVQAGVIF